MAEPAAKKPDFDAYALSVEVGERFDAVNWKRFNATNIEVRNETRQEVLDIRQDLMKVANADAVLAAKVWNEHVPSYVPRPAELPQIDEGLKPVNTIEPGRKRRKTGAEPFLDESQPIRPENKEPPSEQSAPASEAGPAAKDAQAPAAEKEKSGEPLSDDRKDERLRMLLEGLEKQYLKADDKYHFRDRGREVAFAAEDKRILTQHETAPVIASMVDLAEARGWTSLKVTGTDEFKREAWLQASLRDFEVSGYRPTKFDKARLEELRGERGPAANGPAPNVVEKSEASSRPKAPGPFEPSTEPKQSEPRVDLTRGEAQVVRTLEAAMRGRRDSSAAIAQAKELASERLRSTRVHVGKLVEVGTAPYQNRPEEVKSHFVTLEDDKGKRTQIWGMDFPRALEVSGAKVGEQVALAFRGRESVSIKAPVRDEDGKSMGVAWQGAERNLWDVVPFDRLRADAKARVLDQFRKQEAPADIRVFDREAPSRATAPTLQVDRQRNRERGV